MMRSEQEWQDAVDALSDEETRRARSVVVWSAIVFGCTVGIAFILGVVAGAMWL